MDVIALPIGIAIQQLEDSKIKYAVEITRPTRDFFKVDSTALFVIRQHIDADGIYKLVAAAKMGKEVL